VWGHCPACDGNGELPHSDESVRKLYEEWEDYEPETGEGYQLWNTGGEDGPISPVFASAEALAEWCSVYANIFGSLKTTRENWLKMIQTENGLDFGSLLVEKNGVYDAAINMPP
jgi:uncharacterized protein YgfB (UPF0149 family)